MCSGVLEIYNHMNMQGNIVHYSESDMSQTEFGLDICIIMDFVGYNTA